MLKPVADILLTDFRTQSLTEPVFTDIKHSESPTLPFATDFRQLLDMNVLEGGEKYLFFLTLSRVLSVNLITWVCYKY